MKENIKQAIQKFANHKVTENALYFFQTLGYNTKLQITQNQKTATAFDENFIANSAKKEQFNKTKALFDQWKSIDLLFQLNSDLAGVSGGKFNNQIIESVVFMTIELQNSNYSRTQLADVTRQINNLFAMPIVILFQYNSCITLSIIHRRINKKDEQKDVLEKVSFIKDISIDNPHRAQLEILSDFAFDNLSTKKKPSNFVELTLVWETVFSTKKLNNDFYLDLFKWYLWAKSEAIFPNSENIETDKHQSESLIRFISRILFVWFMKEKGLISDTLFDEKNLKSIIKNFEPQNNHQTIYYLSILQNLFFATLNIPMHKRSWIKNKRSDSKQFGDPHFYRYENNFIDSTSTIENVFMQIPFLNGGLFECLDDRINNKYQDGFTKTAANQPKFADKFFFGKYEKIDLSKNFEDDPKEKKKWQNQKVTGIIDLLNYYKFTIEENTPLEIDIALDPELLGKVFENLLASYNPETKANARQQTGSFYTPREIVNYMVDESLKQHLKTNLLKSSIENIDLGKNQVLLFGNETRKQQLIEIPIEIATWQETEGELQEKLNFLFDDQQTQNPFDDKITSIIIEHIDSCKILDPACGSGAYPMGILLKLVNVLHKIDPKNKLWKEAQINKVNALILDAKSITDSKTRNNVIAHLENNKLNINKAFENNELNYGRKLYLIQNCIYGVDLQPIAIQIAKLRFFISLLVDQTKKDDIENLGFEPLPNMDFKLVAANSLIGAPSQDRMDELLFANEKDEFFVAFDQLTTDYFNLHLPDDKKIKKNEIIELIAAKVNQKQKELNREIEIGKTKNQEMLLTNIALWNSYKNLFNHQAVGFFETQYFFPKVTDGFDIVIGNPPYVQVPKGIYSENQFPYSEGKDKGKQNLYKVFVENSYNLLRENGVATMIVQSSLMCDVSSQFTRELLLTKTTIKEILEFPKKAKTKEGQVFDNVLQGTCIYNFTKAIPKLNQKFNVSIDNDVTTISKLKYEQLTQQELISIYPNGYFIPLVNENDFEVIQKLNSNSKPLIEYIKSISQGDINLTSESKYFSNKNSETVLLRGKHTHKYSINYDNDEFIQNNHKSNVVLLNQKVIHFVCQQITGTTDKYRLHFAITSKNKKFLFGNSVNKFSLRNESYNLFILAILNSKLMDWYFRKTSTNNHVNGYEIEQLPIIIPSEKVVTKFEKIVNSILKAKKSDIIADHDTSDLENEIDIMVYKLYDLSYAEAKIIDGNLDEDYFNSIAPYRRV